MTEATFCCEYCEHNAGRVCDCQPCTFIRSVGFQHEDGCPWGKVPEATIEELIERSSLGTPAAKALRARTTDAEVARVREIAERIRQEQDGNTGSTEYETGEETK